MMENALSVSELNEYARRVLSGDALLRNLQVTGEISGYKHHYSGHRYFTLKDADARIQCVMFRQNAVGLDFQPRDGMQVTLQGNVSIFVRDGSYQFYVSTMRSKGFGDLYARFEQLKARLAAEGMFDPAIKKEIPRLPRTIGIVTSETGAAIRDMIQVARRRNPKVGIIVAPCSVQGEGAPKDIVQAIRSLNKDGRAEVLLVGRGGGSIEDLWAFNEEIVARAIAESQIPVVSCVGHEVDFTIADFVADLRAPTPSAAAELTVPVLQELETSLQGLTDRLSNALYRGLQARKGELDQICSRPVLLSPDAMLIPLKERLTGMLLRACQAFEIRRDAMRSRLTLCAGMLRSLNPDAVLKRGYAAVYRNDALITEAAMLNNSDSICLHMKDGHVLAVVSKTELRDDYGEEKTDV